MLVSHSKYASRSGHPLTGNLADADNDVVGVAKVQTSAGALEFTIEPMFSLWDNDNNYVGKNYRGTYLRHNQHDIWEMLKAETWEEAEAEAYEILEAKYSESISRMAKAKREHTKVKPLSVAEIRQRIASLELSLTRERIAQWALLRMFETADEDARAYLMGVIDRIFRF